MTPAGKQCMSFVFFIFCAVLDNLFGPTETHLTRFDSSVPDYVTFTRYGHDLSIV